MSKKPQLKVNEFKLTSRDIQYKRAFNTVEGQKVLNDLKISLGYQKTIFQYGKSDRDNAFEQGRQSVINDIMFILNKEAQ